jgi:hypothetical protein
MVYLMRCRGFTLIDAYELLVSRRPSVAPNAGIAPTTLSLSLSLSRTHVLYSCYLAFITTNTGFMQQLIEYALTECAPSHQHVVLSGWLARRFRHTDLFRIAQRLELEGALPVTSHQCVLDTTTTDDHPPSG